MNNFKLEEIFSENELNQLKELGIIIDHMLNREKILEICKKVKEKIEDVNISYKKANKYYELYMRLRDIENVDFEKICKYSKEEFREDIHLETPLFSAVCWSNPKIYSNNTDVEKYNSYKIRHEKAKNELKRYFQYMNEKYGNLNAARAWFDIFF